ncbi:MAG: HAD family phosphatase [Elusimicrobiota bacterium]|jgi:HAD superfamily hydrolase (TIGR01509 family)|nr:HAD family phosphatase [Elusimicrobiota bacterium]
MAIKNIVFDVGGVFAIWQPKAIFRKYFKTEADVEKFMKEIDFEGMNSKGDLGISVSALSKEIAEKFPQYAEAILAYDRDWLDTITNEIDGTKDLVGELKKNGYKIYILSNWESDKFRLFDSKYKILDMADGYIISGDIKKVKPFAEIYNALTQKYNLKGEECVFLDDRLENVEGAKNVGWQAILFKDAKSAEVDLQKLGVKTNCFVKNKNR